jgi:hypothetical protein
VSPFAAQHINLIDGHGVDAATLPDLPQLSYLEVDGLRRSVTAPLKARYHGTATQVIIWCAKSDVWLRANLDNPLGEWVGDHERAGAAACKAYADSVRAIDRTPPTDPDPLSRAEDALWTMVDKLNSIDRRYEIIDTVQREQAWGAFAKLASGAGVAAKVAEAWFD